MNPKHIERQEDSRALLNKASDEFIQHKAVRNRILREKQTAEDIKVVKTDLAEIKNEVLNIKQDVKTILQQITKGS